MKSPKNLKKSIYGENFSHKINFPHNSFMFFMRRVLHRENSIYRTKNNVRKIEGTDEKIYIGRKYIYGEIIISTVSKAQNKKPQ
jgi:hypothetical protein